jgi:hypothetical protein
VTTSARPVEEALKALADRFRAEALRCEEIGKRTGNFRHYVEGGIWTSAVGMCYGHAALAAPTDDVLGALIDRVIEGLKAFQAADPDDEDAWHSKAAALVNVCESLKFYWEAKVKPAEDEAVSLLKKAMNCVHYCAAKWPPGNWVHDLVKKVEAFLHSKGVT